MNTALLLQQLQERDIKVSLVTAETLDIDAPENALTPELAQEIRTQKTALIHLLGTLTPQRQEQEPQEIIQYDTPPLICRKCHTTNPEHFRMNLLRNRWVCCNCGTLSHLIYPAIVLPAPVAPGQEVEQLRREIGETLKTHQGLSVQSTMPEVSPITEQDPQKEHNMEPLPVVKPDKQKKAKAAPLNTSHAILTDTSLVFCVLTEQGRKIVTVPVAAPEHIGDVCNLANEHNMTHVWVMPGTELANNITRTFVTPDAEIWDVFSSYTGDETDEQETRLPMFTRVWKKNTTGQYGKQVKVGYPWRGEWEWLADSPVTLLATIDYLEKALGVPVEWSPGHMFTSVVKMLNRKENRQEWVRDVSTDLLKLPFNKSARDLTWNCQELAITPGETLYVHKFDKNSAYLAACPGVMVGAGEPTHKTDCTNIDVSLPGIYKVTAAPGASIFNGETLPLLINTEWVTSDVLTYALKLCYEITIQECYQWEEKHRTLESTATLVWNARHSLKTDTVTYPHKQGRENAYNTVKRVALIGVGLFAFRNASHFLRPDYWANVVGKARATMAMKVKQFHELGYTPVLIYTDALYFLSPDKNPVTAVPGLTERSEKLGGFKHEFTAQVTPEIIEAFKTLKPDKIAGVLKRAAKKSEE